MTKCIYCDKQYTNASCFKKHFITCDILHSNINTEEILSIRDLTIVVRKLVKDNVDKTKRIKMLENTLNKTKNINLIEYLNNNIIRLDSFDNFISMIKFNSENIDLLLKLGFIEGMVHLITHTIQNVLNEDIPIRSFYENNYLIEYNGNKWVKLTQSKFDTTVFNIQRELITYRENSRNGLRDDIYDDNDDNDDKYLKMNEIILGGVDRNKNIPIIYNLIYNKLKIRGKSFINSRYNIT